MDMTLHRTNLMKKREELISTSRDRGLIAVERNADVVDEIQSSQDRELAIESMNRRWETLHLVDAALGRIDEGTYGECSDCGEAISPPRLKALPWAQRCRDCQEVADADARHSRAGTQSEPAFPFAA